MGSGGGFGAFRLIQFSAHLGDSFTCAFQCGSCGGVIETFGYRNLADYRSEPNYRNYLA